MFAISKHISLKEATKSNTAERLGLDNFPGSEELVNMQALAENIFEPLREFVGGPIYISSFYRSPDLNSAIGGSKRSQHCLGQAIDLDDVLGNATNEEMFKYIRNNLDFDKLIWEFGTEHNPAWVHVSYRADEPNRGEVLRAKKINGKTTYTYYDE
jgi:hypothetical protein